MNKAFLIGNVGKDPEVRYYEQDQAVAQVTLATTERGYTLQNGTQVPDRTEWHNVVFYRGMAKVEGKIRYRSYDDQKGVRRYITEIVAENMEMLSPKGNNTTANTTTNTLAAVSEPVPGVQQQDQENGDLPF